MTGMPKPSQKKEKVAPTRRPESPKGLRGLRVEVELVECLLHEHQLVMTCKILMSCVKVESLRVGEFCQISESLELTVL